MPAPELVGAHRARPERVPQHALREVEPLLEMPARVDGEVARHPEVMERVVHRAPGPPAPAGAAARPSVDLGGHHGSAVADGRAHFPEHARIAPEPRPAGVADLVVEHGSPPPGQQGHRHQAGRMRPVLEEQTAPMDEPVQAHAVVGSEAAPQREVVGPLDDIDGVDLKPARVFHEAAQPVGSERQRARAREVLSLEKEAAHRAQGEDGASHRRMLPRATGRVNARGSV